MRVSPASEEYRARVPVDESTSISARRLDRKPSLIRPVCHGHAAPVGVFRCADGCARHRGVELWRGREVGGLGSCFLRGFRVVAEEVWEGCHGRGDALDGGHVETDRL